PGPAGEGVEELGGVPNGVDTGLRRLETLAHDHAAPHLEPRGRGELDVRLDADSGDDEVGVGRDLRRLEPEVDAVRTEGLVQRLRERGGLQGPEDLRLAHDLGDLDAELR